MSSYLAYSYLSQIKVEDVRFLFDFELSEMPVTWQGLIWLLFMFFSISFK